MPETGSQHISSQPPTSKKPITPRESLATLKLVFHLSLRCYKMATILNGVLVRSPNEKFQHQRDRRNQRVWIPAFRPSRAALNTMQVPRSQCLSMPSRLTAVVPKHPQQSHTCFPPSTSLSSLGNKKRKKREKKKGWGEGRISFSL